MSTIVDAVHQTLSGNVTEQISDQIGADPAQTRTAMAAALPMLLAGMANQARQPGGTEAIDQQAQNHAGVLGGLADMLPGAGGGGGGGLSGMMAAAGGLLQSVLGRSHEDVQAGVAKTSGLDPEQTKKLLMILAPIVLGVIARHRQQSGAPAGQLGPVLEQAQQDAEQRAREHSPQLGGKLGEILGSILAR